MHGLRSAWGDVAVPELGGCGCWVAGISGGLVLGPAGERRRALQLLASSRHGGSKELLGLGHGFSR
jgi:hypothetical protein